MGVSIPNKRSWTARAAALAATAGAAFYGIAAGDVAHAGTSTLVTVTAVSPHVVAADTANRVITVTGTGFDEDVITGVTIAGCTTAPSYVVSSATTLLVKTAADCDPATGAVITVTDTSSNTAVSDPTATGGKMKLDFVAPPKILDPDGSSARPVVTENSAGQAYADQVHTASTTGGTVIRVYADSSYTFASTTACPLAAAVDGVALTKVTVHGSSAGNYFTGVIGAHAADAAPVLKITDACVSKSFQYDAAFGTQTHDFQLAGSTISISPASGAIDGGNTLTITGAGFGNTTTVDVGGTACGSVTVVSSKKITCTVPSVQAAGPVTISTTNPTSVISAGTTYTYLDQ